MSFLTGNTASEKSAHAKTTIECISTLLPRCNCHIASQCMACNSNASVTNEDDRGVRKCDPRCRWPKSSSPSFFFHRPLPAMEVLFLQLVSPYMIRLELARCCLLNKQTREEFSGDLDALRCEKGSPHQKLLGSKRFVAAIHASRWWHGCTQRRWLNRVAWEAARLHAFPHRTETNYPPWRRHFCGGIAGIDRIHATTRFVSNSGAAVACPECKTASASVALWRQVGDKIIRSTPHLDIGCSSCMLSRSFHDYSVGRITIFSGSPGAGELPWSRYDDDSDE